MDLRFVRHNNLHQLPVDRGIVRGLLEDSLEDGGDVVLHYRVCAVTRQVNDDYLAGAVHIVIEDEGKDMNTQHINCLMTQTDLKIIFSSKSNFM